MELTSASRFRCLLRVRSYRSGALARSRNYDFFALWAFQNSAWVRIKRYTGTTGPSLTEELIGQYFYLKLATDASTTKYGFKVSAEYRD